MGELLVWLIAGALLYGAFVALTALWPLILAGLVVWVGVKWLKRQQAIRQCRLDELAQIARRADKQHKKIMTGDDAGGTYGDFMPPKGLR